MKEGMGTQDIGLQCFFPFFPTGRIKWLRQLKFPNVKMFPFHSWRMRMINKGFKENFACSFCLESKYTQTLDEDFNTFKKKDHITWFRRL